MCVQMVQTLGLPRSLGEIYGLIFATPRPLAFQDIAGRLELSKGSVSQGLKFLRLVGAIKPVEVPADRREHFEPVLELKSLVGGFLRERINPQLAEWGVRTAALQLEDFARTDDEANRPAGLASAHSEADSKVLAARIDKLRTWQKRAHTVLPMVGKLLS